MKNPWKRLSSKIVYENPWIKLREDKVVRPDGSDGMYSVVELGEAVYIVALTDEDEIYLIGQYRYPTGRFSWEVPNGGADSEDMLAEAQKELREETGLMAQDWHEIGCFQSFSGVTDEIGHVFIARQLKDTGTNEKNEEGTSIIKVPFDKAIQMVKSGEITCAQTTAVLMQTAIFLQKISN